VPAFFSAVAASVTACEPDVFAVEVEKVGGPPGRLSAFELRVVFLREL
jgi:hypothetical protein